MEPVLLSQTGIETLTAEMGRLSRKFGQKVSITVGPPEEHTIVYYSNKWYVPEIKSQELRWPVSVNPVTFGDGNEYTLMAKLEDGLILKFPNGYTEELEQFRYVPNTRCDVCNKSIQRNVQYILLKDGAGTLSVVGGSCTQDLLGKDAQSIAQSLEKLCILVEELVEETETNSSPSTVPLKIAVKVLLTAIENFGYTSGKKAYEEYKTSTKEYMLNILFGRNNKPTKPSEISEDIFIQKVRDALENSESSEFNENMRKIFESNTVKIERFGFVAASWLIWERLQEEENSFFKDDEKTVTVGETSFPKIQLEVGKKIVNFSPFWPSHTKVFSTDFGTSTLVVGYLFANLGVVKVAFYLNDSRKDYEEFKEVVEEAINKNSVALIKGKVKNYNESYESYSLNYVKFLGAN